MSPSSEIFFLFPRKMHLLFKINFKVLIFRIKYSNIFWTLHQFKTFYVPNLVLLFDVYFKFLKFKKILFYFLRLSIEDSYPMLPFVILKISNPFKAINRQFLKRVNTNLMSFERHWLWLEPNGKFPNFPVLSSSRDWCLAICL